MSISGMFKSKVEKVEIFEGKRGRKLDIEYDKDETGSAHAILSERVLGEEAFNVLAGCRKGDEIVLSTTGVKVKNKVFSF